jgi:transcriptional regulator with XRE-family HTH domain
MNATFGNFLKRLRLAKRITLRDFCLKNGFDPGNYSRIERGLFQPPQREDLLAKYAVALGLVRGSDEWIEFFDTAAAARGEIPKDILSDEEVVGKLPAFFRTLRGSRMDGKKMDAFIDKIRRS